MRVAVLWFVLAITAVVFVHMLVALRSYRAQNVARTHSKAVIEYGWTIVPWLIVALGAAPAVRRLLLAAG